MHFSLAQVSKLSIFPAELLLTMTPKQDWTTDINRRYSISMSPFVACVEALDEDTVQDEEDVNFQQLAAPKSLKGLFVVLPFIIFSVFT